MATYFISDLHLGATYQSDTRSRERMVVDFLHSIRGKAERLFLVGDILDYWYEYRTVVPRGYVRFFGALAELADAGTKITWFIGNHDIWLFDYLRDELGIEIVDGSLLTEIDGKCFYITHGDAIGTLRPGFKLIRGVFRNRFCQWLYAGIHPRWTVPFALRWSSHSRTTGCESTFDFATDPMVDFARRTLVEHPDVNYFVFGHRHVVANQPLADGCQFVILGDWLNNFTYGVFEGGNFVIEKYTSEG